MTCQTCGDQYTIGETRRPLCVRINCIRIKEHLDGMIGPGTTTALGAHRRHNYGNSPFEVDITILSWEPEVVARETSEAFWITAKNPKVIGKEKCIGVVKEQAL
ncbi:hypothetical protein Y032_0116g593 [Ancylostoma ceylanicum]|uniref:Uncharacterized protein n=1 Tax=Ancylostoma ceylanicum TaxID=53326 RepID=A0A016TCL8_9BILA|nr:hypothetical protein Y032_0116g593 [Ancylostoma ceylanicum]